MFISIEYLPTKILFGSNDTYAVYIFETFLCAVTDLTATDPGQLIFGPIVS